MVKFKEGRLPLLMKDRIEYLFRYNEILKLYHNKIGQKYKDGKITLTEFREFQNEWFEPRFQLISTEINKCKSNFAAKSSIIINPDDIEEE